MKKIKNKDIISKTNGVRKEKEYNYGFYKIKNL